MEETIGQASLRDAAIRTGIAVDKMLALTGQTPVLQIANIVLPTAEKERERRERHVKIGRDSTKAYGVARAERVAKFFGQSNCVILCTRLRRGGQCDRDTPARGRVQRVVEFAFLVTPRRIHRTAFRPARRMNALTIPAMCVNNPEASPSLSAGRRSRRPDLCRRQGTRHVRQRPR